MQIQANELTSVPPEIIWKPKFSDSFRDSTTHSFNKSMAETFFKFPRTRHIFDAGGAAVSRDDLIMTEKVSW